MGGTISAITNEFGTLVTELVDVLPDAAYAVAHKAEAGTRAAALAAAAAAYEA